MNFLSNIPNPKSEYAKSMVTRARNETQQEAWENHLEWLEGKIIGDPSPTSTHTVEQLKAMDMVGVYLP